MSVTLFALLLFALPSIASGFVVPTKKAFLRPNHATNKSPLFAEVPVGEVISATMRASRLTYSFAALRNEVRENPDSYVDASDILEAGDDDMYTEDEIVSFVRKNEDKIVNDDDSSVRDLGLLLNDGMAGDTRIRSFDDKDQDDELVFGIGVNRSSRRVNIAFRGTNSKKDMLVDLDIRKHVVVENDTEYEVHRGFRNYLKGKTDQLSEDGPLVSKFKVITNQLEEIMKDCEGFDIYVTGHSLGGSLATYYGFKLAEKGEFPMVNVVSFASPYVGTESFQEAFRELEREGKLRHIRVSNDNDCIPANPCVGGFEHAGVNVQLRKSGPTRVNIEGVDKPPLPLSFIVFISAAASVLIKVLSIFIGFLSFLPTFPLLPSVVVAYATLNLLLESHDLEQYRERFESGKDDFYDQTIEELYQNRLRYLD